MPERLQIFGCSLRSALLKGALLTSPGLEAAEAGGGESFSQAVPLLWGDMGAVSTGFLCHSCFRLSLTPEDAAETLWPQV